MFRNSIIILALAAGLAAAGIVLIHSQTVIITVSAADKNDYSKADTWL